MIEKFITKRAQSRGDSGFARVFTIMAMLLLMSTGAWADDWTNIVINSNMEGDDVSCFYVKENAKGAGNMYLAHITEGIGKDGSKAIKVQSDGKEVETWDTQFFIRLPYELPAGTKYRLSFDYKADKAADADFQCANEPGEYIIWYIGESDYDDFSFTTDWQNFSKEYTVPAIANGNKHTDADWLDNFQTIYFSLALNKEATEYIIDNVKVEILNSVLSPLNPSPVTDPKLMVAYPPYTVSLAEGTVDADNWTITPTEGAYEGETVTATYGGTKHVKSVKAVKKEAVDPAKAYMKWDADQKKLVATDIPEGATPMTSSTTAWAGTYVVEGDVEINANITLSGNVDLIIKDGAKLTAKQIYGNSSKYNLSIYGQANKTGQLVVNSSNDEDAIAGITTLEVHSAKVTATSSSGGCSGFYEISTFNVYGGSVDGENTGSDGYGILLKNNGSMNIYGGDVKAVGKGTSSYGIWSSSATVTVYGGKLWAENADKKAIDFGNVTLTKDAGYTSGKIEYSSDKSTWSETKDTSAKYVRVGY